MAPQTTTVRLSGGALLTRHFDPTYGSADAQCGSLAQWRSWLDQLAGSLGYYRRADGSHLLLEKLELHSYSCARMASGAWVVPQPDAQMAEALTYPLGAGRSRIVQRYYDAESFGGYKFPAALSHEAGHAFHNWCGFYCDSRASGPLQEVARAWEKMISQNHTSFAPGVAPWDRDPGQEQFANAFRVLFGTYQAPGNTRGSSGNAIDPVLPGFVDPAQHLEWGQAFQLMPELCAFIEAYGARANSLQWGGGRWQLVTTVNGPDCPAGTEVYQNYYYTQTGRADGWFKKVNGAWQRFSPRYNRF